MEKLLGFSSISTIAQDHKFVIFVSVYNTMSTNAIKTY